MSGAPLGTRLLIYIVVPRRTVPSRVAFPPLATLLSGHSDSFVPRLDGVLAVRFGRVFPTGCHHLTTPCLRHYGSAEVLSERTPSALYPADASAKRCAVAGDFLATTSDCRLCGGG